MTAAAELITVLLVDDHAVVREGYRRLLERNADIRVVAEAGNAALAYQLFRDHAPQVVVLDISLPDVSGIEVLRRILAREPRARVLVFSMHEEPIFPERAMRAGALGYITKASAPEVLVNACVQWRPDACFLVMMWRKRWRCATCRRVAPRWACSRIASLRCCACWLSVSRWASSPSASDSVRKPSPIISLRSGRSSVRRRPRNCCALRRVLVWCRMSWGWRVKCRVTYRCRAAKIRSQLDDGGFFYGSSPVGAYAWVAAIAA